VHGEHTSSEEFEYIAVLILLGMMFPFANEPHRERHTREYGVKVAPKSAVAGADCGSGQAHVRYEHFGEVRSIGVDAMARGRYGASLRLGSCLSPAISVFHTSAGK
jgi:hypothetical protein